MVKRVRNGGNEWRATQHSFICSKHFEKDDYIKPPTADSLSCRLKRNAIPSLFKIQEPIHISEEAKERLQKCENTPVYTGQKRARQQDTTSQPAKVQINMNYEKVFRPKSNDTEISKRQLKSKIRNLQQQLRRCKSKIANMSDLITSLEQNLIVKTEIADRLHASFDKLQLSIFNNAKNNTTISPCGRRYTDDIKEFSLTLYFYSPKAYEYVRSIIPLPNPSLIRKWSSSVDCEPGFLQEAFQSLQSEAEKIPSKKDCCLIIDAMSIRKQTLWDPKKEKYSGFVNYGPVPPEDPETLASESLVFILVGTRTRWKCPIGYFLSDKMNAKTQAQLVRLALEKAADAGLRVWSITADGTCVNISTFAQLGCIFSTTYDSMVTTFKHPSQNYNVYIILDPCHMLKLARNALASMGSFHDEDGGEIQWKFFHLLHSLQDEQGLKLGNKFSAQHLEYQKHKMNVRLAAQTLSSSVADAIQFLDVSMKLPQFKNSGPTVNFTRVIDRTFDILNSRCPQAKGYKQPLQPKSKDTWENHLKSAAEYLLSLVTKQKGKNKKQKLLSTHKRKTFIIGFVATIKSTIQMANEMFSLKENPFHYLLTYKFSQDHLELLFSCLRSKGGWNNNPNSMQLKYTLRQMLFRNAVKASKNSNCIDFSESFTSGIIPIFHKRKHRSPLVEETPENDSGFTPEEQLLVEQLEERGHSEFMENILFYISGYIVTKLITLISCTACRSSLISSTSTQSLDHDYCGMKTTQHSAAPRASAFTLFINRGGLTIPSQSVFAVVKYAEHIFKAFVAKDGRHINSSEKLRSKMIMQVCHHFVVNESCHLNIFGDHDPGMNEVGFDEDHRMKLIKYTADKYFTLRLFTYGKRYCQTVVENGKQSDRFHLTKLILFQNQ